MSEFAVKNYSQTVSVTPTVSTSPAYTSGDQVGTLMTISNAILWDPEGKGGILHSVVVVDSGKQSSAMDIFFYSTQPTVASSDNAAADVSDSEQSSKCIGYISILASDYATLSANSTATKANIGLILRGTKDPTVATQTTLYALAVARGTPTYATTTDLTFKFSFLQD